MSTAILGLDNALSSAKRVASAWGNDVSNLLELTHVQIARVLGSGILSSTHFNGTAGAWPLVNVSPGLAIVGEAGSEKLVAMTSIQGVTIANGNNWLYVSQDKNSDGTPKLYVETSDLLVTGREQIMKVVAAASVITSIDNFPTYRKNLVSPFAVRVSSNDRVGQYLNGALVAGTNIALTENADGADETLTVGLTGQVAIANGGTAGATAAAARTNLGAAPATEVQGTPTFVVGAEVANVINVSAQLKDAAGANLAGAHVVYAWLSGTAGGAVTGSAPDTSAAIGTNGGIIKERTTRAEWRIASNATGAFDLNLGHAVAGTWYLNLEYGGRLYSSGAITFA